MKTNRIRQNLLPLLTALIWGTAFVAQSVGAQYLEPFTFNAARAIIAFVFLLVLCAVLRLVRREKTPRPASYRRDLAVGAVCCGSALAIASFFQQKALVNTTAGKAGFITALYIVLVPIFGLFLKKRAPRVIWLGVVLAVAGLYFLCINEEFVITGGDFYLLLCAVCFAVQILTVDHFTQRVEGVELSCGQFLVMSLLSTAGMLAWENPSWGDFTLCLWPVLYVGVFSSGVAYTLQILAQKDSNPTVVSLIMSLESVFAAIAGAIILQDSMTGREYLGCALMMAAVVLTQLPDRGHTAPGTAEK